MNKLKIKNSFYWILTLVLLSGPAHEIYAQRTRVPNDHRNSVRKTVEKKKDVRRDSKKNVKKNKQQKATRKNSSNRINGNKTYNKGHERSAKVIRKIAEKMKEVRRDLKKNIKKNKQRKDTRKNKSYRTHENRTYKKGQDRSKLKSKSYHKKSFGSKHYRKPSWIDYFTPRHHHHKIGTRFSFLPHGYITFRIGDFRFFSYQGTYYRYDPVYRNYIVIEKPVIESNYTSTQWDRITLMDGSTIEGVYISGDSEIVVFEVGDALLEIPKSEIQVLSFSQG